MSFRDSRQNRLYRNVYNKSTWNFLASTGTRSIGIGQGLKTVGAQAESGARAYHGDLLLCATVAENSLAASQSSFLMRECRGGRWLALLVDVKLILSQAKRSAGTDMQIFSHAQ
jgi:hypothetical protein